MEGGTRVRELYGSGSPPIPILWARITSSPYLFVNRNWIGFRDVRETSYFRNIKKNVGVAEIYRHYIFYILASPYFTKDDVGLCDPFTLFHPRALCPSRHTSLFECDYSGNILVLPPLPIFPLALQCKQCSWHSQITASPSSFPFASVLTCRPKQQIA